MAGDVSEAASTGRVRRLGTRLPPIGRSAGEARDFVGAALRSWGVAEPSTSDIVLATSELVTNAIEHSTAAASEIVVELAQSAGRVVLRVWDDTDQVPVRKPPSLLSERSRGLTIVAALSTAWGYESARGGKWVWAEFGAPTSGVSGGVPAATERDGESAARRATASLPLDN
ncbi:ATP-binding protein [Actinokineospora enzanensis]|uniref:ATP-binding protein n=1 Tax=Actinokineospora enzanensis TaxID=155975 RepID=UPI001FDF0285|nr:ATP-binding protein [Actinokineospora enzanensis]